MQVLIRHDNKAMLDKQTKLVVPVDFTLAKQLDAPAYTSLQDAVSGGEKFSGAPMARGTRLKVCVSGVCVCVSVPNKRARK